MRTREDLRSWGSFRDESQATSHDSVIVFGFRRMRTGPFAFARGQISPDYYIPAPSVPPEHLRSGWRRVRGGTHFHPSGPGNRVTSTWSGELPFLSRIPDRPPRVLASSFPWCVPREGEATLGSRTPGR